jgi:hypothetical protein
MPAPMTRRRFMAQAAALNAALLVDARVSAAPARSAFPSSRFERVVADARLTESVAFAATMTGSGIPISIVDGDPTSLWFDELARHFSGGGAPVAGLTTARTALVMIELARGPGVRLLWHAEHRALPTGASQHRLHGSADLIARAETLAQADYWHLGIASLLARSEAQDRPALQASTVVHLPRSAGSIEQTLSSWVVAPRRPTRAGVA